jgi:hypothetical protein
MDRDTDRASGGPRPHQIAGSAAHLQEVLAREMANALTALGVWLAVADLRIGSGGTPDDVRDILAKGAGQCKRAVEAFHRLQAQRAAASDLSRPPETDADGNAGRGS